MIRLFLLAAGFLSVTIALLVTQMGDPEGTERDGPGVTSAATRADSTPFEEPRGGLFETAHRTTQAKAPETLSSSDAANPIDLMTQSILSELRRPVTGDRLRQVATQTGGHSDEMRNLTDTVLAGLGGTPSLVPKSDVNRPQSLNALIIQAVREGKPDAYVDSLINEAVGKGQVAAPDAIVTSSGEVDTATILDSLVQKSNAGTAPPAQTPSLAPEGDLTYVVQPGDSLAGIALRHYGTTTAHDILFMANRDKLPAPSAIRPGMTLTIPTL
ncbi:LysM peptidoglycan-binding domain-containing protein [Primorskyibacter aestuariivivens]|uniref:LysM peptidoglycan-binding domain-containing protein n=1 Tax=Primorskyibacter aestuariivivens TaxID=1888912 RepID=UPI002301BD7E|nr:LysM peptidoglycan-binding domain-containing protein [Primorskyibacter aestuariivivens]MDA7427794.1 LysM peptidoglycan-binding domain-containing protein [Primorskyibacter aestuariivivens]